MVAISPIFDASAILDEETFVCRPFACHIAEKAEELMLEDWPDALAVYARERDGRMHQLKNNPISVTTEPQ